MRINRLHSRTHRRFVFVQNLIVLAHRYTENDGRDVFETMNPLFTLRPLTSDVEQPEIRNSNTKSSRVHQCARLQVSRCKSFDCCNSGSHTDEQTHKETTFDRLYY